MPFAFGLGSKTLRCRPCEPLRLGRKASDDARDYPKTVRPPKVEHIDESSAGYRGQGEVLARKGERHKLCAEVPPSYRPLSKNLPRRRGPASRSAPRGLSALCRAPATLGLGVDQSRSLQANENGSGHLGRSITENVRNHFFSLEELCGNGAIANGPA